MIAEMFQGLRKRLEAQIEKIEKYLTRMEWQPIPIFLPGEFQGQRVLVGYSPWDHKELDTTEQVTHTEELNNKQINKTTEIKKYTKRKQ